MIIISLERLGLYYKSTGFRKNSRFPETLVQRANHIDLDLFNFFIIHEKQQNYYRTFNDSSRDFICKVPNSPLKSYYIINILINGKNKN